MDDVLSADPGLGPDGLDLALQRELRRGERVLWQGRPIPRVNGKGFGMYLFAIPWTAFSLFWTAMASGGAMAMAGDDGGIGFAAWAFPLFGVPFIAVGLGMLAMPFWPLWSARRTLFAVTDQRLLKLSLGRELKAESLPAERIGHVERAERSDGSGMLKIAMRVGKDSEGDRHTETFDLGEVGEILGVARKIDELVARARRREVSP